MWEIVPRGQFEILLRSLTFLRDTNKIKWSPASQMFILWKGPWFISVSSGCLCLEFSASDWIFTLCAALTEMVKLWERTWHLSWCVWGGHLLLSHLFNSFRCRCTSSFTHNICLSHKHTLTQANYIYCHFEPAVFDTQSLTHLVRTNKNITR